jgi:hypothetical protein
MFQFDELGARPAAVGAYLVDVGVCLGSVPIKLGRVDYFIGESGLRLGESGFKFFSFGHDLCRGSDCGVSYLSIGVGILDAIWENAIGNSAVCVAIYGRCPQADGYYGLYAIDNIIQFMTRS